MQGVGNSLFAYDKSCISLFIAFLLAREKKGAEAEVDYIIQHENQIIPIEVKAGAIGSLKSLHQFMSEKKKTIGVRINSNTPSICPVQVKDSSGNLIEYKLLSLPFYLLGQLHRLIKSYEKTLDFGYFNV